MHSSKTCRPPGAVDQLCFMFTACTHSSRCSSIHPMRIGRCHVSFARIRFSPVLFCLIDRIRAMVVVQEVRHPRSLDFSNERKAMVLRDQVHTWKVIIGRVKNISGARPSIRLLQSIRSRLQIPGRPAPSYRYHNCGRRPWKVPQMEPALWGRCYTPHHH